MRGVIHFLQAEEILGYLDEEASSLVKLFCCTTRHVRILLREQFHWDILEHTPYSSDRAPSDFFLLPKMKEPLAGKRFEIEENMKDAR